MREDQFQKLLAFVERLDEAKMTYAMEHSREDSIMVTTVVPGEYWEIEFLADGTIDVERYRSNGQIEDESALKEFFAKYVDPDFPPKEVANQNDACARK